MRFGSALLSEQIPWSWLYWFPSTTQCLGKCNRTSSFSKYIHSAVRHVAVAHRTMRVLTSVYIAWRLISLKNSTGSTPETTARAPDSLVLPGLKIVVMLSVWLVSGPVWMKCTLFKFSNYSVDVAGIISWFPPLLKCAHRYGYKTLLLRLFWLFQSECRECKIVPIYNNALLLKFRPVNNLINRIIEWFGLERTLKLI